MSGDPLTKQTNVFPHLSNLFYLNDENVCRPDKNEKGN